MDGVSDERPICLISGIKAVWSRLEGRPKNLREAFVGSSGHFPAALSSWPQRILFGHAGDIIARQTELRRDD
jgi:hypothetical protein